MGIICFDDAEEERLVTGGFWLGNSLLLVVLLFACVYVLITCSLFTLLFSVGCMAACCGMTAIWLYIPSAMSMNRGLAHLYFAILCLLADCLTDECFLLAAIRCP